MSYSHRHDSTTTTTTSTTHTSAAYDALRRSLDEDPSFYPSRPPPVYPPPPPRQHRPHSSRPRATAGENGHMSDQGSSSSTTGSSVRMKPKADYEQCVCGTKFGWMTKKHHCHFCGNVYCSTCLPQRLPLPPSPYTPVAVCAPCNPVATVTITADPSFLSVATLKAYLGGYGIDSRGCVEKSELVDKVKGTRVTVDMEKRWRDAVKCLEPQRPQQPPQPPHQQQEQPQHFQSRQQNGGQPQTSWWEDIVDAVGGVFDDGPEYSQHQQPGHGYGYPGAGGGGGGGGGYRQPPGAPSSGRGQQQQQQPAWSSSSGRGGGGGERPPPTSQQQQPSRPAPYQPPQSSRPNQQQQRRTPPTQQQQQRPTPPPPPPPPAPVPAPTPVQLPTLASLRDTDVTRLPTKTLLALLAHHNVSTTGIIEKA
ncbi:hypothetical protein HKX48_001112 [Thoreauomyces humboldtii]|nr:hypothetical protein HKX48_001112 [Thoreauomyces humboldtii]